MVYRSGNPWIGGLDLDLKPGACRGSMGNQTTDSAPNHQLGGSSEKVSKDHVERCACAGPLSSCVLQLVT